MDEIVSILKEIKEVLAEIRKGITDPKEDSGRKNDLVHVGDIVYDIDGRAMIVTQVNADTFQAEYVD